MKWFYDSLSNMIRDTSYKGIVSYYTMESEKMTVTPAIKKSINGLDWLPLGRGIEYVQMDNHILTRIDIENKAIITGSKKTMSIATTSGNKPMSLDGIKDEEIASLPHQLGINFFRSKTDAEIEKYPLP